MLFVDNLVKEELRSLGPVVYLQARGTRDAVPWVARIKTSTAP